MKEKVPERVAVFDRVFGFDLSGHSFGYFFRSSHRFGAGFDVSGIDLDESVQYFGRDGLKDRGSVLHAHGAADRVDGVPLPPLMSAIELRPRLPRLRAGDRV